MPSRLTHFLARLGRIEKAFLALLVLYFALSLAAPRSVFTLLALLVVYFFGLLSVIRLVRRLAAKFIWRLRNRLIVAYLFIAVVPIVLVVLLVAIGAYIVIGQTAVYLVSTELHRRTASLAQAAEALSHGGTANRAEITGRLATMLRTRWPDFELLIRNSGEYRFPPESELEAPPPGWKDAHGLVIKHGSLFAWAHVKTNGATVTIAAPLNHNALCGLIPGLGDVNFLRFVEDPASTRDNPNLQLDEGGGTRHTPAAYNSADIEVTGVAPLSLPVFERPGGHERALLMVYTRTSAVLGIVFGQGPQWGEAAFGLFAFVAILFLLVEIVSLFVGVSITRTVTGAVHELYLGTERVKEGDFSHRIPVRGDDQLAELGHSFNTMTENLARLIVVAKEKERLQSELEIAREVQNQLFPKAAPTIQSLELTGVCNPARMVSGDYYDFIPLAQSNLAFAIGDVAGKGISAALLMAAIQSIMRSQLTGRGEANGHFSTAHLVANLNRQLYANTAPEKYATFYFGIYDSLRHVLTYTNAGHLPPLLLRQGEPSPLEVTGTVVGAFPLALYEEKEIGLDPGDTLVAYTDGIVEPENVYGEMFGEERLKDLLVKHARADGSEIIARVMEAVVQWTGAGELQDDMTMVVARRL